MFNNKIRHNSSLPVKLGASRLILPAW